MKFLTHRTEITQSFIDQHILKQIPDLKHNLWILAKTGDDSFAIDFGNTIVRFPRSETVYQALKREKNICKKVQTTSIQIPNTHIVDAEYPFSYHTKIQGTHLLPDIYENLLSHEKQAIAEQICDFFLAVHQISISEARSLGVKTLPPYVSKAVMQKHHPSLPEDLKQHLKSFLMIYEQYIQERVECFGYFDAHGWNMAFNAESKKLNGIYDFADCGIGEIHQEFHPLNAISADLTLRVVQLYNKRTGLNLSYQKVNIYTLLAEYSDLCELMGKTEQNPILKEYFFTRLRKWHSIFHI